MITRSRPVVNLFEIIPLEEMMITIKEIADAASVSPVNLTFVRTLKMSCDGRTSKMIYATYGAGLRKVDANAEEARKLQNCNLIIGPLG